MRNMRITTESGAVYVLDSGICYKTGHDGEEYSPFKAWFIKALDDDTFTWDQLRDLPNTGPVIGKRMYISGKEDWWVSTKVISIADMGSEVAAETFDRLSAVTDAN